MGESGRVRVESELVAICEWIDKFLEEHRYAPTVREVGASLGISSSSTAWMVLSHLKRIGWVDYEETGPRTLRTTKAFRERNDNTRPSTGLAGAKGASRTTS